MKTSVFVVALLLGAAIAGRTVEQPCRKKSTKPIHPVIKSELKNVTLPDTWIWNDINGVNYLTNLKN